MEGRRWARIVGDWDGFLEKWYAPPAILHPSLFGLSQPGRSCTDSTLSPCRWLSFFRCFWEPQIHMRYTSVTINGSGRCRTAS